MNELQRVTKSNGTLSIGVGHQNVEEVIKIVENSQLAYLGETFSAQN
ncbi:hypothetical protein KAS14_07620 [Candidatus Bathyarchaeota archaeon]|nr:hypothetical protein [Candidatus Bathyarchaeota archaeon]